MKYIKTFENFNYLGLDQDLMNEKIDSEFLQVLCEELKVLGLEVPGTKEVTWGDLLNKGKELTLDLLVKFVLSLLKLGTKMFTGLWKMIQTFSKKIDSFKQKNPKTYYFLVVFIIIVLFLLISANQAQAATTGKGPIDEDQIQAAIGWIKTHKTVFSEKPAGVTDNQVTIDALGYLKDLIDKDEISQVAQKAKHMDVSVEYVDGVLKKMGQYEAVKDMDTDTSSLWQKLMDAGASAVNQVKKAAETAQQTTQVITK